jgi:hypothetical protein
MSDRDNMCSALHVVNLYMHIMQIKFTNLHQSLAITLTRELCALGQDRQFSLLIFFGMISSWCSCIPGAGPVQLPRLFKVVDRPSLCIMQPPLWHLTSLNGKSNSCIPGSKQANAPKRRSSRLLCLAEMYVCK